MKRLISYSLLFVLLIACNKNISELPPATQTGANIFAAKINGTIWIAKGFGPFPANDIVEARMSGRDIIIIARNFSFSPNESEFQLTIYNVTMPGTYLLNTDVAHPNGGSSYAYFVKRTITPENEWMTNSQFTGSVNFSRIDTANMIASGTFEFNAINQYNDPVPIYVSEGRFDVKIQ